MAPAPSHHPSASPGGKPRGGTEFNPSATNARHTPDLANARPPAERGQEPRLPLWGSCRASARLKGCPLLSGMHPSFHCRGRCPHRPAPGWFIPMVGRMEKRCDFIPSPPSHSTRRGGSVRSRDDVGIVPYDLLELRAIQREAEFLRLIYFPKNACFMF